MSTEIRGIAILLWATRPEEPALAATPFMHAAAAAALDLEVEVHFSAQSVRLLLPGVAESLFADTQRVVPIATFMREAREHGAKFLACTTSIANLAIDRALLDGRVDGYAGASSFQARAADPAWRVMVF
jgi:uncharacterized protein